MFREVWPGTEIFLCLWHVRRAWQKHACAKVKDPAVRAYILRDLQWMMYTRDFGPSGEDTATEWAQQVLGTLRKTYPNEKPFWDYMDTQWGNKVHMWVVGYRNMKYAGQDTNAAIEGYHSLLKAILKSERSRMAGRRVDWCVWGLHEEVEPHYWYTSLRKEGGFVDNKKKQDTVVSALLRARSIPETDVTLPTFAGGPAFVTSQTHRHLRYIVYNPEIEMACCNCVHAQRGNICKHQVKVLLMLNPHLAEGTIARFCGREMGKATGGLQNLLTPSGVPLRRTGDVEKQSTPAVLQGFPGLPTPKAVAAKPTVEDLEDKMLVVMKDIFDDIGFDSNLMLHFIADLRITRGRIRLMKAEVKGEHVHAVAGSPALHRVDDGRGMKLARDKDFLERGGKSVMRKLRLGGD
jgi:hypothetical protein